MFEKINNLIKNYSFTSDTANKGFDSMKDIVPDLKAVHDKFKNTIDKNGDCMSKLTAEELSLIIKHNFKQEELDTSYFKINTAFFGSTIFQIDHIELSRDRKTGELSDLVITLKETLYNSNIKLTVPIESFKEFLIPFKVEQPKSNRRPIITRKKKC
ncbi:MAG: hypothetical protein ACD_33C00008G0003 [uncultured bacterium]|nr:MAG: hypothetical protein ACD_33C00008G0003 [uncultured bacterium]